MSVSREDANTCANGVEPVFGLSFAQRDRLDQYIGSVARLTKGLAGLADEDVVERNGVNVEDLRLLIDAAEDEADALLAEWNAVCGGHRAERAAARAGDAE